MFGGGQDDAVDQVADGGAGFLPGFLRCQCVGQFFDLFAVAVGYAGVQRDHRHGVDFREVGAGRVAVGPGLFQRFPDFGKGSAALRDRRDQAFHLARCIGEPAFEAGAFAACILGPAAHFLVVFFHEDRDEIGREQAVLQPVEDAAFIALCRDLAVVVAHRAFAPCAAAPLVRAFQHPRSTADAASAKPAEQVARASRLVRLRRCVRIEQRLDADPQIVIDDAEVRDGFDHPLIQRVGADAGRARHRLDDLRRAVVDQLADVEAVFQHAVAARAIRPDGRRPPAGAARAGDAILVQAARDGDGAQPAGIFGEDAAHDLGLVQIDFAQATDRAAIGVDAVRGAVAVGEPSGRAALPDGVALAAFDIVAQLHPLLFVQQALDRALEPVDFAIAEREEAGAVEIQAFANVVAVALVAGHAACRIDEHLFDAALFDPVEHRGEAGALRFLDPRRTADRVVGEDVDDGPAFAVGAFAADLDLLVDRPAILKGRAVSGVD